MVQANFFGHALIMFFLKYFPYEITEYAQENPHFVLLPQSDFEKNHFKEAPSEDFFEHNL